jgi:hypothetical protein
LKKSVVEKLSMRMCPESERECCDTVLRGESIKKKQLFFAICTVCKEGKKNQDTASADVIYVYA